MIKIILYLLALSIFLNAQEVTDEQLNSIYTEAILFVTVFSVMGIISYIYSSRHAKAYVKPNQTIELTPEQIASKKRLEELLKMLEDKILTEDEFELLEHYYK